MVSSTRPGARGSRSAKEANAARRREDALKDTGVISESRLVHEQVQAEALSCPHCQQQVHPHNWMEHHHAYHSALPPCLLHRTGKLPLGAIRIDGDTQMRVAIDEGTVNDYAALMQEGVQFPPVEVYFDGKQYWLVDGFHRLRAMQKTHPRGEITATVTEGTLSDAQWTALNRNGDHGLRLTNADKHKRVECALAHPEGVQKSDREIARHCQVSHPLVAKIRTRLSGNNYQIPATRQVSRNGTTYSMNTAQIGTRPALPEEAPPYLHTLVDSGQLGIVKAVAVAEKLLDPDIRVAVQDVAIDAQVTDPDVVDVLSELHAKKRETFEVIATTGALDGTLPLSEATVRDLEYHLEYARREHRLVAREEKKRQIVQRAQSLPEGCFNVIYADPPWRYDNAIESWGAARDHYDDMTIEEICGYPAAIHLQTDDNAALFLWATNPFLPDALRVIQAWGFTYKTNLVWVKRDLERPGTGFYVRGRHELLLLATRGSFLPLDPHIPPVGSVIEAPVAEHSVKPDDAYSIIEALYPNCRYIELFARRSRAHWTSHGDQLQTLS